LQSKNDKILGDKIYEEKKAEGQVLNRAQFHILQSSNEILCHNLNLAIFVIFPHICLLSETGIATGYGLDGRGVGV
jgi:hypothetical protein